MVQISKADTLLGLKRFKRLAEQDIHASAFTQHPTFWKTQAEARIAEYNWLIDIIHNRGVDHAYRQAKKRHADLPLLFPDDSPNHSEFSGTRQALEVFLTLLGKPLAKQIKVNAINTQITEGESSVNAQV